MEGVAIEEYLRGKVGFSVEDNAIVSILIDRNIESGSLVSTLSRKQRDLCTADLYMWCASTPSIIGSVKDSDGNWSHQEGGTQSSAFDKRNLRAMASDIYKKYGENKNGSSIKVITAGMKIWRN